MKRLLLPAALALFLLRLHFMAVLPFNIDECMEVSLAGRLARGELPYSENWKSFKTPLINVCTAPVFLFSRDSADALFLARFVMAFFAGAMALAVYLCACRLRTGAKAGAFALLFLCASTTFLERGTRVRTDLASTALWAWALYLLVPGPGKVVREDSETVTEHHLSGANARKVPGERAGETARIACAGLLLGTAFLFTQKAVYFIVIGLLLVLARLFDREGRSPVLVRGTLVYSLSVTIATVGPLAVLSILGGPGSAPFEKVFLEGAIKGTEFFTRTYGLALRTVALEPGFWLLGLIGLLAACLPERVLDLGLQRQERLRTALAAAGSMVFTILHTKQWPYIYLMPLPAFALLGGNLLSHLCRLRLESRGIERIALPAALALLLLPFFHRVAARWSDDDLLLYQIANMECVERITAPDDSVFDLAGLVATRRIAYGEYTNLHALLRYARKSAGAGEDMLPSLERADCRIFVLDYRTASLPRRELEYVSRHFLHVWGNVFTRGKAVEAASLPVSFTIDSPGTYSIDWSWSAPVMKLPSKISIPTPEALPEGLFLDGRPLVHRMRLAAGRHSLNAAARTGISGSARDDGRAVARLPEGWLLFRYMDGNDITRRFSRIAPCRLFPRPLD